MAPPIDDVEPPRSGFRGIPRSSRALFSLVGTSLLAGIVSAMFAGGIALALGLSPVLAGGVSGSLAAGAVAWFILRDGPAD